MFDHKYKKINNRCSGFTLIELVVVVALMSVTVFTMAQVFAGKDVDGRFDRTVEKMQEIRKAILGSSSNNLPGEMRFAGYVSDMGELPALWEISYGGYTCKQPKGLWTTDLDDDGDDDLVRWTTFIDMHHESNFLGQPKSDKATMTISLGWRGPYLKAPKGSVLTDGWGNPFIFELDTPAGGDLTIKSLGANRKPEGSEHDRDTVLIIRKSRYLAPVAGYVAPNTFNDHTKVIVKLYYAPPEQPYNPFIKNWGDTEIPQPRIRDLRSYAINGVKEDGYFLFEQVPVGCKRLLKITQPVQLNGDTHSSLTFYRFSIVGAANWLGFIEMETIYEQE